MEVMNAKFVESSNPESTPPPNEQEAWCYALIDVGVHVHTLALSLSQTRVYLFLSHTHECV